VETSVRLAALRSLGFWPRKEKRRRRARAANNRAGEALACSVVIAGLDPAIHFLAKRMDARVKPGHDEEGSIGYGNHKDHRMATTYQIEPKLPVTAFQQVLLASTLGERRPINDLERLERMLRNADVIVTARDGDALVGVARAITDFAYCCYLSDLAVAVAHQRRGIGKRLIEETHKAAGLQTTLILVSAPAAESYYPKIGMQRVSSCWSLPRAR
jgi:predicted N-acetyltransferase YhbS